MARKTALTILAAELDLLGDYVQGLAVYFDHLGRVEPTIEREAQALYAKLRHQQRWCRDCVSRLVVMRDEILSTRG